MRGGAFSKLTPGFGAPSNFAALIGIHHILSNALQISLTGRKFIFNRFLLEFFDFNAFLMQFLLSYNLLHFARQHWQREMIFRMYFVLGSCVERFSKIHTLRCFSSIRHFNGIRDKPELKTRRDLCFLEDDFSAFLSANFLRNSLFALSIFVLAFRFNVFV